MSVVTASSPTCREETIVLYPKNTITFAETIQTSSSAFTATVFIRRSVTVLSFNEQNSRHSYDGLGRMTDGPVSYDLNGSITSIGSLPSHTFYEGRDEDIFYTYLADGTLLVSDKSDDSDVHVYAGCLVTDCDGELAEGVFCRGVMDYGTTRYQMKDHLGSVRVTFDCCRIPELRCQVLRPQNRLFPLSRSQGRAIFRN